MGIRGKAKAFLAVILSVVLLLGVVSWQKAQAQRRYTAEEVSNLAFNDALYLLRTVFVNSVFTQINNRRYQMDEIFNMVYDDSTHSIRVTVLADSAHEFQSLWADTILSRIYATKNGACIYFWMRGIHGDTIAKFEDRNHNVMAYLDSMKEWHASGYDLWTWTGATPTTKRKIWTRGDTLFWNDSTGAWHPVYPATPGIGIPPDSVHEWAGAWIDTVYAKYYASKAGLSVTFWMRGIRGDTIAKFVDRNKVIKSYLDSLGEWHAYGYDFWVWGATDPTAVRKLWARDDSLFWNDAAGSPHAVYPAGGAPSMAFGDTNAYYVSKIFGPGRDSIGGYYFNTIQAAINQARTAGASATNKKTVYIFEGTYMEPCTLKNWVNIKGAGQLRTYLRFPHDTSKFIARGAANFTVEDVSILCHDWDGANAAGVCSLSTASCSSVVYKNTTFREDGSTANFRFVISGQGSWSVQTDSVTLENCHIGGPSQANVCVANASGVNSASLFIGKSEPYYVYLNNVNINTNSTGGINGRFALMESCNVSIWSPTLIIKDCRITSSSTGVGAFRCETPAQGRLEIDNSLFLVVGDNPSDTAFVSDRPSNGPFTEINNSMFRGLVGCAGALANSGSIRVTGSTVFLSTYPFFGNASFGGTFEWNQSDCAPSNAPTLPGWHYGEVFFDTTKTPSNYAAPHEAMEYYKSNATPNDTLMVYMDAGWRNLDRTWATGRDSVLANNASDTLSVTGIQTTSFVEINLESDPGANIGCPYHTKTANVDILVWPTPCVNKFYYRWRIH